MQVPKKFGTWKYSVPELEFGCEYKIEKDGSIRVDCSLPMHAKMSFLYNDPKLQKRIKENYIISHPGVVPNYTDEYHKRLEEFGEDEPIEFDPVEREKYFISTISGFVYTSRYFPNKLTPHELESKLMDEAGAIIEKMMGVPKMFKIKEDMFGDEHFNGFINFLERIDKE
jgi:hypothetical protein